MDQNTHLDPSELTDPSESRDPCLANLGPGCVGITSQLRWTPLVAGFLRPPRSQSTHTQVNVMYRVLNKKMQLKGRGVNMNRLDEFKALKRGMLFFRGLLKPLTVLLQVYV